MIIRFKFCKKDEFKYLSHLDILKILSRSIARAKIKATLSAGFNPKPKLTLSNPIPLGVQSFAEYADVEIEADIDVEVFIKNMNSSLPDCIRVLKAVKTDKKIRNLMSAIDVVVYEFLFEVLQDFSADIIMNFITGYNSVNRNGYDESSLPHDGGHSKKVLPIDKPNRKGKSVYKLEYKIVNDLGGKKIFMLKIFGYAKIFSDNANIIFKFNNFYKALSKFLLDAGISNLSAYKTGVYIIKEEKLFDPFEAME